MNNIDIINHPHIKLFLLKLAKHKYSKLYVILQIRKLNLFILYIYNS